MTGKEFDDICDRIQNNVDALYEMFGDIHGPWEVPMFKGAPSSLTHTMIVDPKGVAHYNEFPDAIRPPAMYG